MTQDDPRMDQALAGLQALRERCDAAFAAVRRQHPEAVACRPGCDDCCQGLFDLAPIEALALARAFAGLPRRDRREALRRAAKAAKAFDQGAAEAAQAGGGEDSLAALSRARVPCPLLAEHRCLLHGERPLTCRLYGVPVAIAGAARTCARSRFQPGVSYPTVHWDQVAAELERLSALARAADPALPASRRDLGRVLLGE